MSCRRRQPPSRRAAGDDSRRAAGHNQRSRRAAIALLKRWGANANDEGVAVATLLAVFGTQGPIGRMIANWSRGSAPTL
jgi:hypothetical protein